MWKLHAKNVTLQNKSDVILQDWNCVLSGGEMIGIYNGSRLDSTAILLMMGGYVKPTKGFFYLSDFQESISITPTMVGLGPIRKVFEPIPYLRVEETIRLQADLYKVKKKFRRIKQVMEEWGLQNIRKERYKDLSVFNQLKTSIAASVIHRPRILLLDHPRTGITDEEWELVWEHLQKRIQEDQMILALSTVHRDIWNQCQIQIDLSKKWGT